MTTDTAMRKAFEDWMLNVAKIVVGSTDPYPAGLERDHWECWQAAWNAARTTDMKLVGYIHPVGIERVSRNNGVIAKCAFPENISNKPNDVQTIALYAEETK